MRTFRMMTSFIFLCLSIAGAWVTFYHDWSVEWIFASFKVLVAWAILGGAELLGEIMGNYPLALAQTFDRTVAAASQYVHFVFGYFPIPTVPWWVWGASVVSLLPTGWWFWKRQNPAAEIVNETWVRGMKLVSEKKLRRALKRAGGDGLLIGDDMRLSLAKEREGVLAVGATGSGKTAGVINRIVSDVITRPKCKTVIYDVKGDFLETIPSCIYFAPWDERQGSMFFPLSKEIRDQGDCELFALACVPPLAQASNPFWQNAPRQICAALLWGLLVEKNLSWESLDKALSDRQELLRIINLTDKGKKCLDYFSDEESAGNVMSCLQQELSFCTNMVEANMDTESDFSFRDWFRAEGGNSRQGNILVLEKVSKFNQMSVKLVTVIIQLLILEGQSLPNDTSWRRFFILDELGTLPQISNLVADGINLLRQKGVGFVIGIQSFDGLARVYGDHQAREMCNSLATKIIYRMSEAATLHWAEETLGKAEYLVDTRSVSDQRDKSQKSESKNQRREVRPVVMASEIAAIPESRGKTLVSFLGIQFWWEGSIRPIVGYLLVGGLDGMVARCEWKYFRMGWVREATVWAKWVSQIPDALTSDQGQAPDRGGAKSLGEEHQVSRRRKKV